MAKLKKKDMVFTGEDTSVDFSFSEENGEKRKQLRMKGYSGGIIDHYYWGKLAINVEGIKMAADTIPILRDHDTSSPIGFTKGIKIGKDDKGKKFLEISPKHAKLVETEEAQKFVELCEQGFPFQASIYAKPVKITRFTKPETVDINGVRFKDVDTVWDSCLLKEVSVCVFGYDSNTQSSAFSEEIECDFKEENIQTKEEVKMAENLKELKEQFPELCKQFSEEVAAGVRQEMETKFNTEKNALEARLSKTEEFNKSLIKDVVILKEKAIVQEAELIFNEKFDESDLPHHFFEKVKAMLSYTQFVKDGVFDKEKFIVAVVEEIKDWQKFGITEQKVKGSGSSGRKVVEESFGEKDAEDCATKMFELV